MAYGNNLGNQSQVTTIMICGNTRLLSYDAVEMAAENYNVIVTGETSSLKESNKIHLYDINPADPKFSQLFDAFTIDAIWYLSSFADDSREVADEMKIIDALERECRRSMVSKLIVISSAEALNFQPRYGISGQIIQTDYANAKAFSSAQAEKFFNFYDNHSETKTIILRLPHIVKDYNDTNYLGSLFHQMREKEIIHFPYSRENQVDFVTILDLFELLILISEEVTDSSAAYNICSGFYCTWEMLEEQLKKLEPDTEIVYDNQNCYMSVQLYNAEVRKKYGFIPSDNVFDSLETYYERFVKESTHVWNVKEMLKKVMDYFMANILKYVELIVFFILAELLIAATTDSVRFRFVDIRLFYVLLMGSTHGMLTGILGGILECFSLFRDFLREGTNGTMLFYNVDNWLPFVIYLMTGSITGYIRSAHLENEDKLKNELGVLGEKYLFLTNVYNGVIENKGEYKRQILGYQDSFGKIFSAVQKLDSSLPSDIFMNGVQTLESIMNNYSVAIYTVDDWQKYGRLVASSSDLLMKLSKSLKLETVKPVYDTVLDGATWKNSNLDPDMPMYASGILSKEKKVRLIIMLYEADPSQQSLYYFNLFTILCNLISMSMTRALDYQLAIEKEKFYPGTTILLPGFFEENLMVQQKMQNAGIADFTMVKFESKDKEKITQELRGLIRQNDILGCDDDENIYLILMQTNEKSFHFVGSRLDEKQIPYQIVTA